MTKPSLEIACPCCPWWARIRTFEDPGEAKAFLLTVREAHIAERHPEYAETRKAS